MTAGRISMEENAEEPISWSGEGAKREGEIAVTMKKSKEKGHAAGRGRKETQMEESSWITLSYSSKTKTGKMRPIASKI